MDSLEVEDIVELQRRLRTLEVEVKHKTGGRSDTSSKHTVRVRPNDSFKKLKKHISESLDVKGRLSYGGENLDTTTIKIADYNLEEGKNLNLTVTERRPRGSQHSIQLILPPQFGDNRNVEMKIFRTTTVTNLKHKVQDEWGLTVEEQSIYVLGSQNECPPHLNIMQLKQPIKLEVRWHRRESVRAVSKPAGEAAGQTTVTSSHSKKPFVSPYEASSRKRCTQPKNPTSKKVPTTATPESEEVQSHVSVPLRHAPYETIYQLGRHFEDFKKDRSKSLVIECTHTEGDKVDIKSRIAEKSYFRASASMSSPQT